MDKINSDKKIHIRQLLIGLGIINTFLLLGLLKEPNWTMFYLVLTFDTIAIIYSVIRKNFTSITVDKRENVITIERSNLLGLKSFIKADINNLEYTYKTEAISRFSTTKTLRLYVKNKAVIRLNKHDGLNDYLLDNIVSVLDKNNVKRKFIGHQLKDEYVV